jgi:FixJ family two-component response regulator
MGERHAPAIRKNPLQRGDGALPEKSLTVFVVDDDESVRKALKRLLGAYGYHVMTFESAEDFLLSGSVRTEGCILLDIRLPGMSGLDLYEKLASSGTIPPVIFMTAHDTPEWQERAAKMNAVAYLRKPFDQQSLFDAIHLIECHGPNEKHHVCR